MSTTTYYEPYKFPSGILTLVVHGAFFALLYFGFTWQTLPPAMMQVELWQSLPMEVAEPPSQKTEEVLQASPPLPSEQVITQEQDIVLPGREKIEPKPQPEVMKPKNKKADDKPIKKVKPKPVIAKPIAPEVENTAAVEQAAREQALREQAGRERAEKEAAVGKVVDEYKAKIMAKIRRNIVMPANVPDDARAEFSVTLLPGGSVLAARLLKGSGSVTYDNAVERAILKSDPLPLPPDVALFNKFRELKLIFQPTGQ